MDALSETKPTAERRTEEESAHAAFVDATRTSASYATATTNPPLDDGDDREEAPKMILSNDLVIWDKEETDLPTVRHVMCSTNATDSSDDAKVDDRASPTSVAAITAVTDGGSSTSSNKFAESQTSIHQDLEEQLKAANSQRQKMAANLKKKKTQLDQAEAAQKEIELKMAELQSSLNKLQAENDHLRSGLQKVVSGRDDLKNKLRCKNELLRELRAEKEEVERKLKKSENQRAMEQDLLSNYRKLAQHTGYFKWGKVIRVLESQLEQYNASDNSCSSNK